MTNCLSCGREIQGPSVETPQGDVYHYACVEIEYPEPCMTDDIMEYFTPEGTGEETIRFFEFLRQNPYMGLDLDNPVSSIPEVNFRVEVPRTVEINLLGNEYGFDLYHKTKEFNVSPFLFQAVYFGCALEREFPAFADRDDLYPNGESRVSPEEEETD